MVEASVIVCAHNPNLVRLRATLTALRAQSLPPEKWETLLVDNASTNFPATADYLDVAPPNLRVLQEKRLGLNAARRCGLRAALAPVMVFVDDDNVLAPDYLSCALRLLTAEPRLGALGGKSMPQFETAPPAWVTEYYDLLALRDLGEVPLRAEGPQPAYPACAPIGAGLIIRRDAITRWLADGDSPVSDRRGADLSSGGDNEIIFVAWEAGWAIGYDPSLCLTHLIPSSRLRSEYLGRLNRGIQRSWVQVLARHHACPWKPIPRWTVPWRVARAWVRSGAWKSPATFVRWQGLYGRLEGQAAINTLAR